MNRLSLNLWSLYSATWARVAERTDDKVARRVPAVARTPCRSLVEIRVAAALMRVDCDLDGLSEINRR
jgi:hypothetical protein